MGVMMNTSDDCDLDVSVFNDKPKNIMTLEDTLTVNDCLKMRKYALQKAIELVISCKDGYADTHASAIIIAEDFYDFLMKYKVEIT